MKKKSFVISPKQEKGKKFSTKKSKTKMKDEVEGKTIDNNTAETSQHHGGSKCQYDWSQWEEEEEGWNKPTMVFK